MRGAVGSGPWSFAHIEDLVLASWAFGTRGCWNMWLCNITYFDTWHDRYTSDLYECMNL